MKTSETNYTRHLLPASMAKKHFLDTFKQSFTVKEVLNTSENFTLLDSFDWGLYNSGYIAIRVPDNRMIFWSQNDLLDPELSQIIENSSAKSKFWWDFFAPETDKAETSNSNIKKILKKALKLRALSPVYKGILKTQQFNLQDDEGKVLVFCQLVSIHAENSPRMPIIRQARLIPVTGYNNEHDKAIQLIQDLGGFVPTLEPLDSLMNALGITPQPYTIKPNFPMPAETPARQAISSIISIMLDKQRITEPGIIKDIDTEFLHHFRVALRMVRAAVAQLKVAFPEQDVIILKERFGTLARNTNHLRDIDVFILEKERYMNLLPESLRHGLLPMFDDFEKDRSTEVKRVAKWLSGKAYKQEINKLQALFVNGYTAVETEWSQKPSIELAVKKIQKRYKVIQKAASTISHDTPDDDIHSIRIDCKKLRYLLYFFGELFDKKQVKVAALHLKSLQDRLGTFNDLSVQGKFLEQYLYDIEHKANKDILLIASLGGLISTLHALQIQEREHCIKELAIFSNKQNRILFKNTFVNNTDSPELLKQESTI